jgi:hypothetical protein
VGSIPIARSKYASGADWGRGKAIAAQGTRAFLSPRYVLNSCDGFDLSGLLTG